MSTDFGFDPFSFQSTDRHRHTHKVTDATDHPTNASAITIVGNNVVKNNVNA